MLRNAARMLQRPLNRKASKAILAARSIPKFTYAHRIDYFHTGIKKPSIFVTQDLPGTGMLEKLTPHFDVTVNKTGVLSKSDLIKELQGKQAVICFLTDIIDKEVLEAHPT